MDRRDFLTLAASAALLPRLVQSAEAAPVAGTSDIVALKEPLEHFSLWPEGAPGGELITAKEEWILRHPGGDPNDTAGLNITDPFLMVRRPKNPNGSAILMVPGGGYRRVAVSRSGGAEDQWLEDQGFTTFILVYRLPGNKWAAGPEAPLQDGQRAMRLIRHRAKDFGFDPEKIGIVGFSSGGHLAGWTSESFNRTTYKTVDDADIEPAKPLVTGLFFPVLTMMTPFAHPGSVEQMFGSSPTDAQRRSASLEQLVPPDMPPTFLAHAEDDPVVPVENSLMLHAELRKKKIASELHLFEVGGHGIKIPEEPLEYLKLWLPFAKRHGLG